MYKHCLSPKCRVCENLAQNHNQVCGRPGLTVFAHHFTKTLTQLQIPPTDDAQNSGVIL